MTFKEKEKLTGPTYPDPTDTVTAMGTLFAAVGVIGLATLAWAVGSRLVRRYLK